jgi:hypothetical protein
VHIILFPGKFCLIMSATNITLFSIKFILINQQFNLKRVIFEIPKFLINSTFNQIKSKQPLLFKLGWDGLG